MPALLDHVDPDGLLEYSVVYTDRSLNHMSQSFQHTMEGLSSSLKAIYKADSVAIVPGGGSYGMEAVSRQFAQGKNCLILRNGLFSFRWSQILETGKIASKITVMKARQHEQTDDAPFYPAPLDDVLACIRAEKPDLVFFTAC